MVERDRMIVISLSHAFFEVTIEIGICKLVDVKPQTSERTRFRLSASCIGCGQGLCVNEDQGLNLTSQELKLEPYSAMAAG